MSFIDPMLPRMSGPQLKQLVAQACGLIAEREGPEAARSHLLSLSLNLPALRDRMPEVACVVAARHGVTVEDLKGSSRKRRFARPRQEAFAVIYSLGRHSLSQIGAYFGGRDHATVLHGIRAHKARLAAASMGMAAQ